MMNMEIKKKRTMEIKKKMKIKMTSEQSKINNILVILVYFAANFVLMNVWSDSIVSNILGIAFIISGIYGIICMNRNIKFVF